MSGETSTAPPVRGTLAEHSRQTGGPDPVPYLSIGPCGTDVGAAIVLITDIFGISPFFRHLTRLLADQGYQVAVPDIFQGLGPQGDGSREAALARRQLLDDAAAVAGVRRLIDYVTQPPRPFRVLGFRLGGSFARLTTPARRPWPTRLSPKTTKDAAEPAADLLQVASSSAGPVLAHWGRDDHLGAGEIAQLAAMLDGAPCQSQVRWHDDAKQNFLAGLTEPGHQSALAAAEPWDRTVAFFAQRLRRAPVAP